MELPFQALLARNRGTPADLSSSGPSLFPDVPQPSKVADNPPIPTRDTTRYTEAFTLPITFAGAGEQVVLTRQPTTKREGLLIQNVNIAAGIFYCFDTVASNVGSILIPSGGNRLFDVAVPQGDLHVFSSGAGLVIIEFMTISRY